LPRSVCFASFAALYAFDSLWPLVSTLLSGGLTNALDEGHQQLKWKQKQLYKDAAR
jgi:hypothetical protein